MTRSSGRSDPREKWAALIIGAIVRPKLNLEAYMRFQTFLAVQLVNRPAVFMGIVLWVTSNIPDFALFKQSVLRQSVEIAKFMIFHHPATYALWPRDTNGWGAQLRGLRLRLRLQSR